MVQFSSRLPGQVISRSSPHFSMLYSLLPVKVPFSHNVTRKDNISSLYIQRILVIYTRSREKEFIYVEGNVLASESLLLLDRA